MKLYPPTIPGSTPAFSLNNKGESTIEVSYKLNPTVGINEIKGFRLKIKEINTNKTIAVINRYYQNFSSQVQNTSYWNNVSDLNQGEWDKNKSDYKQSVIDGDGNITECGDIVQKTLSNNRVEYYVYMNGKWEIINHYNYETIYSNNINESKPNYCYVICSDNSVRFFMSKTDNNYHKPPLAFINDTKFDTEVKKNTIQFQIKSQQDIKIGQFYKIQLACLTKGQTYSLPLDQDLYWSNVSVIKAIGEIKISGIEFISTDNIAPGKKISFKIESHDSTEKIYSYQFFEKNTKIVFKQQPNPVLINNNTESYETGTITTTGNGVPRPYIYKTINYTLPFDGESSKGKFELFIKIKTINDYEQDFSLSINSDEFYLEEENPITLYFSNPDVINNDFYTWTEYLFNGISGKIEEEKNILPYEFSNIQCVSENVPNGFEYSLNLEKEEEGSKFNCSLNIDSTINKSNETSDSCYATLDLLFTLDKNESYNINGKNLEITCIPKGNKNQTYKIIYYKSIIESENGFDYNTSFSSYKISRALVGNVSSFEALNIETDNEKQNLFMPFRIQVFDNISRESGDTSIEFDFTINSVTVSAETDIIENRNSNYNYTLVREDSKNNKIILKEEANLQIDNWYGFYDCSQEHGELYKYYFIKYDASKRDNDDYDYVRYSKQLNNLIEVKQDFNGIVIIDKNKKALSIEFNQKMSSFKPIIQEQKIETIGSKYPYFSRNSNIYYHEFPIGGLISYNMDNQNLFINSSSDEMSFSTDLTAENIYKERIFKQEVLKWLTNGEPKLLKTPTEGNFIVYLTNVSLTPIESLGRMIHQFTATATEIEDCSIENLKKYRFITGGN